MQPTTTQLRQGFDDDDDYDDDDHSYQNRMISDLNMTQQNWLQIVRNGETEFMQPTPTQLGQAFYDDDDNHSYQNRMICDLNLTQNGQAHKQDHARQFRNTFISFFPYLLLVGF